MSSTNRTQIRYIEEANWGELPSSGAMQNVRDTGDSLTFGITSTQSNEIRSDRQVTDLILTGAEAGGDIEMEFSAGNADAFMESAMYNEWEDVLIEAATDIGCTAPHSIVSSTTDFVAAGLKEGMFFHCSGFSEINNGEGFISRVQTVSANEITIAETVPDIPEGQEITINASRLVNGIKEKSFSIERELQDVGKFFLFSGMVANQWTFNAAANSVITETFSFIGKNSEFGNATFSPETPLEAPSEPVMNAVTDVVKIYLGGTTSDIISRSLDFTVNNNVRGLEAISYLGSADLAEGDFVCTGSLEAYFQTGELYEKFLASEEISLELRFKRNGCWYYFTWPRVKISTDEVTVPGRNDDVMETIEWQALYDADAGFTMMISRMYDLTENSNPPWHP